MKRHVAIIATVPAAALLLAGGASAGPGSFGPLPLRTTIVTESTPFTSPSGNIGCYIEPNYVRCDIRERSWERPPKPADCPDYTGWGQGLTLRTGQQAEFVCAGDTTLGVGDPLAYGDKMSGGSIECTSLTSGMQCWDVQYGGEFTLSREGYDLG